MLAACRLAGLSALGAQYGEVNAHTQSARVGEKRNRVILRRAPAASARPALNVQPDQQGCTSKQNIAAPKLPFGR